MVRLLPRFALLATAMLLLALLSLAIGARQDVTVANVLGYLVFDDQSLGRSAVWDLRLPRMLIAALVGMNLAMAGLALQAVTRNALASESVLGINQGAAFGVALAVVAPALMIVSLDVMAILGAVGAGTLTFAFAGGLGGRLDSLRLILSGIAVGAFAFALVRFAFIMEDDVSRLVLQWTSADISSVRWDQALALAPWTAAGIVASFLLAHGFNLLALGEGTSQGLGVDPRRMRLLGALLAAVLTGVSVAAAGPVGFVGLVVPHLCRPWVGTDHRLLLPAALLGGASLMLGADVVSKLVRFPYETPVGVICALIGAPYFLYVTIRAREMG